MEDAEGTTSCGQVLAGVADLRRNNLCRAGFFCCVGFLCIYNLFFVSEIINNSMAATSFEKSSNSLTRTTQPPSVAPTSIHFRKQNLFANNSASASSEKSSNSSTRTTQPSSVAPTSIHLRKQNPFEHFLMHIPKSGTSHALVEISRLVWTNTDDPQFKKTRVCNEGTKKLRNFNKFHKSYKGVDCNLWMTEQPFSSKPEHVYAILRDPRSHTLSMYFHCKESKDHQRLAHRMPSSLNDWLKGWVDVKRNNNSSVSFVEEQNRLNREWACYNPINFQTRWIGHPEPNIQNVRHHIFDPSLSNATATSASGERNQYQVSLKDLRERYLVLGDQAQMDKSICMIYTHYRGYVTEQCDCTNATVAEADDGNVDTYLNQSTTLDHGVSHHGDSYKTTPEQDAMIAFLRDRDTVLYDQTREIFAEQVRKIEEKYGVKICDKMKSIDND